MPTVRQEERMPSVFESAFFYFYDSPGLIFLTSTTGKDVRVEQEI